VHWQCGPLRALSLPEAHWPGRRDSDPGLGLGVHESRALKQAKLELEGSGPGHCEPARPGGGGWQCQWVPLAVRTRGKYCMMQFSGASADCQWSSNLKSLAGTWYYYVITLNFYCSTTSTTRLSRHAVRYASASGRYYMGRRLVGQVPVDPLVRRRVGPSESAAQLEGCFKFKFSSCRRPGLRTASAGVTCPLAIAAQESEPRPV
jgi:hypothetical protein